jgi:hypothetical protein
MLQPDTRSGFDHYDARRFPDRRGEIRALPLDPGPTHALLRPERDRQISREWRWHEPVAAVRYAVFLDGHEYERAACGRVIKVVLPFGFDAADPDACEYCARHVSAWLANPKQWWSDWREHQRAKASREREEADTQAWRAREAERLAGESRQAPTWQGESDPMTGDPDYTNT